MYRNYVQNETDIYDTDFYLVDEAHYIGADNWGEAFRHLQDAYHPIVIGFTATPQRFEQQGTEETIVKQFFSENSAGNYTAADLQKKGLFQEPEYILSIYDMEKTTAKYLAQIEASDLSDVRKERLEQRLEDALADWKKNSCPEKVMAEAIPRFMYKSADNRVLVYVPEIKDIEDYSTYINRILHRIFPDKRIRSYSYTYKDRKSVLDDFCSNDGKTYIRVMYSVNRIMETIHINDLCIAIMLWPAVSDRIIIQQFGRLNSIGNDKKPLIIDMVDNLSNLGSSSFANVGAYGQTGQNSKNSKMHIRMNLRYVSGFRSLFETIDAIKEKTKLMTVDGFTGTLSQICSVMGYKTSEIREWMNRGYTIEEALQTSRRHHQMLKSAYIDGFPEYDMQSTKMSTIPEEKLNSYMQAIQAFAESRKINDEDTMQNLYLYMLKELQKNPGIPRGRLVLRVANKYATLERNRRIRKSLYDARPIQAMEYSFYTEEDSYDAAMVKMLNEKLWEVVDTQLKPKESAVLKERYVYDKTLEEAGKTFSLSNECIRKIEAKALRKMRTPTRSEAFKDTICLYKKRERIFAK